MLKKAIALLLLVLCLVFGSDTALQAASNTDRTNTPTVLIASCGPTTPPSPRTSPTPTPTPTRTPTPKPSPTRSPRYMV